MILSSYYKEKSFNQKKWLKETERLIFRFPMDSAQFFPLDNYYFLLFFLAKRANKVH